MDKRLTKIACIDLDGTLTHYKEWQGENHFGDVINGSAKALQKLKDNNWLIIIYTTRANKALIKGFLESNGIPFDFINENPYQPENAIGGKLDADVYIDDRVIQFNGIWDKTIEEAMNFMPWELKNNKPHERQEFASDFLKQDFNQGYQQLRHYDSLSWDITKFSFIELLIGITSVWAIYGYSKNPVNASSIITSNYMFIIPSIIGISYIFSILASFLISRNRVYYSKVAKYLNEHRHFLLSVKPLGFENKTKFYTNINFPCAFDIWNTQLVSLYVIQFVSSIMFGIMILCLLVNWIDTGLILYLISIFAGILSFAINVYNLISYMRKNDAKFGD